MNQESAGGDTTDLRVKILELRREVSLEMCLPVYRLFIYLSKSTTVTTTI